MTGASHREVVEELATAVRRAAADAPEPGQWIGALKQPIHEAMRYPGWLASPFRRVQGHGTYYLLWRDEQTDVSLISMVLGPHDQTPIHDHQTWGVVGVYAGTQRETRFTWSDGALNETSNALRTPGSVTQLLPPEHDIHLVRNETDEIAISVFFMGANLGCRSRFEYKPDGRRHAVLSGYANASCPGQTRSPFLVSQFM